jgi:hypothetical protein
MDQRQCVLKASQIDAKQHNGPAAVDEASSVL